MPSPAAERQKLSAETTIDTELKPRKENPEKGKLLADISPKSKVISLERVLQALPTYQDAQAFLKGDKSVALMDSLSAVVVRGLVENTNSSTYRDAVEGKIAELKQHIPPDRKEITIERHGVVEQISSPEEFKSLVEVLKRHIADEIEALAYLDKGVLARIKRMFSGFKERRSAAADLKAQQQEISQIALLTEQPGWDKKGSWKDAKVQLTIGRLLDQFQLQREKIQQTLTNGADLPTENDYVPTTQESAATVGVVTEAEADTLADASTLAEIQDIIEDTEGDWDLNAELQQDATKEDAARKEVAEPIVTTVSYRDTTSVMSTPDFQSVQAASQEQQRRAQEQSRRGEQSVEVVQTPEEQEKKLQEYARRYVEITELNQQLVIANEEAMAELFAQDATLQGLQTQLQDQQFDAYRKPNGNIDSKAPLAVRRAFNTIKEQITARERKLRKQPHDQPEITLIRQQIEHAQHSAREIKKTLPQELVKQCEEVMRVLHVSMLELSKEMSRRSAFEVLQQHQEQIRQQQRAEQLAKEQELNSSWDKSQERGERIIATGRRFGLEADQAMEAVQQNQWPIDIKRLGTDGKEEVMRLGMEPVIISDRERLRNALPDIQAQYSDFRSVMQPEETPQFDALLEQRAQAWNAAEQVFEESNQRPELFAEVLRITAEYNKINTIDEQIARLMNHPKYAERRFTTPSSVWASQERATPEREAKRTRVVPIVEPNVDALLEDLETTENIDSAIVSLRGDTNEFQEQQKAG